MLGGGRELFVLSVLLLSARRWPFQLAAPGWTSARGLRFVPSRPGVGFVREDRGAHEAASAVDAQVGGVGVGVGFVRADGVSGGGYSSAVGDEYFLSLRRTWPYRTGPKRTSQNSVMAKFSLPPHQYLMYAGL